MKQRVGYGALAIGIILAVAATDVVVAQLAEELSGPIGELLRHGSVLPMACLWVILLGATELHQLFRLAGMRPHAFFAYVMICLLMLSPWLSAAGWLGRSPVQVEGLYWQIVWLAAAVIGSGALSVLRRHPPGVLADVGATLTMILYLGFLPSFAVQLRCGRDVPGHEGAWLLTMVLLVTKASDIGAYFVGSTMGRHKLMPSISPGKSIEGSIGGLAASAIVAVLFTISGAIAASLGGPTTSDGWPTPANGAAALISEITRSFRIEHGANQTSPIWRACLLGFALSAAGQLGDLLESSFKRDAGAKDSGNVMPRYGGILDLIDSPVLAVPVAWFLLTAVWNVV